MEKFGLQAAGTDGYVQPVKWDLPSSTRWLLRRRSRWSFIRGWGPGGIRRSIEDALVELRLGAIQMGAVVPRGLVACIESKDEIASVFVAGGGRMLAERSLARGDTRDFWYEGCAAQQLAWYGDRLVVVSRERGLYLRSMDPDGRGEEGMPLADAWRTDRDLVFWAGADPGLLSVAALPSLDARPPLPFRSAPASSGIRFSARQDGWLDVLLSGDGGSGPIRYNRTPNGSSADGVRAGARPFRCR